MGHPIFTRLGDLDMTFKRSDLDTLYGYCLSLTGHPEDAEDLLHTALERFFRKRPSGVKHPLAYVRRIVRNQYFDGWRRDQVVAFETYETEDPFRDVEEDLEAMMVDRMTVEHLWNSLNPAEREVVFLWAVEGLSASEISVQLGQPRGTILSRLHRMRKRIASDFPNLTNGGNHD